MLLKMKKNAKPDEIAAMLQKLIDRGHAPLVSEHRGQTVIGLEKPIHGIDLGPALEESLPIATPYKLVSRAFQKENTVIRIGDVEIGGSALVLMGGPCAIESVEQLILSAEGLKKCGVQILRASAYKPRTSPYSFQGLKEEGLKMHSEAKKQHGLLIETEVMDVRDVALVASHVDILRIGARNMQNYDLLKEVGKSGKPVILKRGLSATVEEWLLAAEYIVSHGNPNVILCERGIRTFEPSTRNTLDLSGVAVARLLTHLPVIVDPSHAAGRKDILGALCKAAAALGADGLLIEVHPDPKSSLCDKDQALSLEEFREIADDVKKVAQSIGRTL